MNTAQIKSFLMAAECLNFTAAADKLYISQPVLSRNIAALETELDMKLFVRSNNTLRLTPAGEIMYKHFKESTIVLNDAVLNARQANMEPQGELRIGFVTTETTVEREAATIIEFQRRYPRVRLKIFHLSAQEVARKLTEHAIDVAAMIDSSLTSDPRLDSVETGCYDQCIAVSRAHPLAEFEEVPLRAFANDVFVSATSEYSPGMTEWLRGVCGAAGFTPRILEVETTREQMEAVEAQRGVALVTENHISRNSLLVRQLRLKDGRPIRLLCVWDRQNVNPYAEKYLEILKETEQ